MPVSGEIKENRRLNGIELRKILEDYFSSMLQRDGMLASQMSYGRVGIDIDIKLHLGLVGFKEHRMKIKPQENKQPTIPEPAPLKDVPKDATAVGLHMRKEIDNPNKERIRHNLPIPGKRRSSATGRIEEVETKYTPDEADVEPDDVEYEDTTGKIGWEV